MRTNSNQLHSKKETELKVIWSKSQLDDVLKNCDDDYFDEILLELDVPREALPSIKDLFLNLVTPGYMTTEAFVRDCIHWQETDWPTDLEIDHITNTIGLFCFWSDYYETKKSVRVLSMATSLEVMFSDLRWSIDADSNLEIKEVNADAPSKTLFSVPLKGAKMTNVIDDAVANYCKRLFEKTGRED